jgi:hypothetical protein
MVKTDIVDTLLEIEGKLPMIYRKDIREAVAELRELRRLVDIHQAALRHQQVASFLPDYPEHS